MEMGGLIGIDTESHSGVPYSIQVSIRTHTAIMVLLKDTEAIDELRRCLLQLIRENWTFVFHYAPADLPIVETLLGMPLDGLYRDTMLEAYGFANLGRLGLKSLARRILGRQRLSWEETVTPYSKEVLGQWIMNSFVYAEQSQTVITPRFHKKSGKPLKPLIVYSSVYKLLRELWTYSLNNEDYPIWTKLHERIGQENLDPLIEKFGPVPVKGIAHCPIDVQIEYACSDPDDTRQLAIAFDVMRKDLVEQLNVQQEDHDDYVGNGLRARQEVATR